MKSTAGHILLIHVDQMRWDAPGYAGGQALTPNLDRLAERGVVFNNAHAQSPVCMPSRISMFSGRYPSALQIEEMGIPAPEGLQTLPSVLKGNGFTTGIVGKLHFVPHANRDHTLPHPSYGFERLEISEEPGAYEDAYLAWVKTYFPHKTQDVSFGTPPAAVAWRAAFGSDESSDSPRDDYADVYVTENEACSHSAWVGSRTVESVKELSHSGKGFLVASFFSPHSPYFVPKTYWDLYEDVEIKEPYLTTVERSSEAADEATLDQIRKLKRGYFAQISEVDFQIGQILAAYEEEGLIKDLLVIFTSDHGEWAGDNFRFSKGFPADDPVTRVPLIFSGAGIETNRTVDDVVELVSVAPTILALSGVATPSDMQGLNLFSNDFADDHVNKNAITESFGWRSLRSSNFRYLISVSGDEHLQMVHNDRDWGQVLDVDSDADAFLSARKELILKMLRSSQRVPRDWPY